MSSPTNPPYQSKLFSFLNRQYIKLKDNSIRTWRGFKVALTWSSQIVLYPIYLLVQTGRLLERQLRQRTKLLQLPSREKTTKKSQNNDEKPAIEATLKELESWFPQPIEAIATERYSSKLVLVQKDNHLLDILSPNQQKELNNLIIENIANYWRQRQENEQIILAKKFPNVLAPIKTDNTNIIPPIRWFWEIMQWIQYSPVAMSVNLFGEVYLEPIVNEQQDSFEKLQNLITQAVEYFFSTNSVSKVKLLKEDNYKIGESRERNYLKGKTTRTIKAAKSPLSLAEVKTIDKSENWLTWEDLYYEYVPIGEAVKTEVESGIIPLESEAFLESENQTVETDYLETKAISLGYVQHPLEKILKWLDRVVNWVENLCLNIWQFFLRKR
jgi:hypothetical protein